MSSYDATDWPQILALYDELLRTWPAPVVALNRAVAVAMVHGPEAADAYRAALALTDNATERAFLAEQLG